MAKIYMDNYKSYLQEIFKLQVDLYLRTDTVLPLDPQNLRPFLPLIKPTSLSQDKKSILSLMGRDRAIETNEYKLCDVGPAMSSCIMLPARRA